MLISQKNYFIFKQSKIVPLCISMETVEEAFFVTGLETLQILGVEMSTRRLDRVKCSHLKYFSRFIYQ
jgi:hypothetical protein